MCVNNLPRVVAGRCTGPGRESNPGPFDLESNTLTTTPPIHLFSGCMLNGWIYYCFQVNSFLTFYFLCVLWISLLFHWWLQADVLSTLCRLFVCVLCCNLLCDHVCIGECAVCRETTLQKCRCGRHSELRPCGDATWSCTEVINSWLYCYSAVVFYLFKTDIMYWVGTVENHSKKMAKNTAHFCENRKNYGKITAVYIAANLLKLMVSNSRQIYV